MLARVNSAKFGPKVGRTMSMSIRVRLNSGKHWRGPCPNNGQTWANFGRKQGQSGRMRAACSTENGARSIETCPRPSKVSPMLATSFVDRPLGHRPTEPPQSPPCTQALGSYRKANKSSGGRAHSVRPPRPHFTRRGAAPARVRAGRARHGEALVPPSSGARRRFTKPGHHGESSLHTRVDARRVRAPPQRDAPNATHTRLQVPQRDAQRESEGLHTSDFGCSRGRS